MLRLSRCISEERNLGFEPRAAGFALYQPSKIRYAVATVERVDGFSHMSVEISSLRPEDWRRSNMKINRLAVVEARLSFQGWDGLPIGIGKVLVHVCGLEMVISAVISPKVDGSWLPNMAISVVSYVVAILGNVWIKADVWMSPEDVDVN
ncbi:hypothetical protein ACLB2K_008744 [Fragaria x ananassa]